MVDIDLIRALRVVAMDATHMTDGRLMENRENQRLHDLLSIAPNGTFTGLRLREHQRLLFIGGTWCYMMMWRRIYSSNIVYISILTSRNEKFLNLTKKSFVEIHQKQVLDLISSPKNELIIIIKAYIYRHLYTRLSSLYFRIKADAKCLFADIGNIIHLK